MYDDLIKRLRAVEKMLTTANFSEASSLISQAADAIEELQKKYLASERDATNLTGWLAEEHAKHLWIPVTERLPSWGEDVLISISGFCNVGYLVQTNDEKQYNWYYSGWYHDPLEVTHWMPLPSPPVEE